MTKYFMQGTRHAAFERMMMEPPKGPGRLVPQKRPQQKRKRQYTYQKGAKD